MIGADGVEAEDGVLLGLAEAGEVGTEEAEPGGVGDAGEADGPVRGGEEAGRGEGFGDEVEVGGELGGGPVQRVGFRDKAAEFAEDVGAFCEGAEMGGPGLELARGDAGLGDVGLSDVVQDEELVGVLVDEADGLGEVALEDEEVVGEVGGGKEADAGVEVWAEDEVGVGFGLDDVAEAFEVGVGEEGGEDCGEVWAGDGGPADDACDLRGLGGERQEPVGLFEGLAGLDGDGGVDMGFGQGGEKIGRRKSRRRGARGPVSQSNSAGV